MKLALKALFMVAAVITAWFGSCFWFRSHYPLEFETFFRPSKSVAFTTESWSTQTNTPTRLYIANSLVSKGVLREMTEQQINGMLGRADSISDPASSGSVAQTYYLCPQRSAPAESVFLPDFFFLNFETWVLSLEFSNNVVVAAYIRPS